MKTSQILTATIALLLARTLFATTYTWDGGGLNDNINNPLNWVVNSAPVSDLSNTDLIFTGMNRLAPNVSVAFSAHKITFQNIGGFTFDGFTIGGQTLTVGTGGIVNILGSSGTLNKTGNGTMYWAPSVTTNFDLTVDAGSLTTSADGSTDFFNTTSSIAVNGNASVTDPNSSLSGGTLNGGDNGNAAMLLAAGAVSLLARRQRLSRAKRKLLMLPLTSSFVLRPLHCARRSFLGWLLLWAVGGLLATSARGASYTFTNIADSDGMFTTTWGIGPSINNSGVVAFLGFLDAGGSGIFVGNGSTVTPIALSGSTFTSFGTQDTPINNSGFVAFFASPAAGGGAVFASDGTTTKTIASGPPFNTLPSNTIVSINNAGAVAFESGNTGATSALYVGNGSGPPAALYRASDPMFSIIATRMSINDSGQVAFSAFLDAGGSGIYRGDGGTPAPIALSSQGYSSFNNPALAMNNAGTVVFIGGLDGSQHVFTGNGGATTSLVNTGGAFATVNFPAINSAGRVAFFATEPSGNKHIQTGPDPVADKVIRNSDPLFGSIVNDLRFSTTGLNDSCQVAFYYSLTDGRKGIAVATPVLRILSITQLSNGTIRLEVQGVPNLIHTIRATADLNQPFLPIGTATAAADGTFHFDDPDAPNFTQRF
jgi:hypothetical protein